MFRIKICGVTSVADARAAFQLGADMVGLNFYSESPRFVSVELAKEISAAVPATTGVFVNASADEINEIADQVGLSCVQLHGDEPASLLADIRPDWTIVRVRTLDSQEVLAIAADLAECESHGRGPDAILVDARIPGEYGGTGKTVDWPALAGHADVLGNVPLILAGGLHGENVAEAIRTVRPFGVDTASGVESAPGVKDATKMQSFIQNARLAFEQLDEQ